jgi:tetratricopeptide (TPR) repeat protein
MLDTHLKKKQEAELLYRRAILIEPNHGYALYNLAVLLEERYSSALEEAELALRSSAFIADESPKLEILSLYQRASEADPKDDTTLADYGRYAT